MEFKQQHTSIVTALPVILGVVFVGTVAIGVIWFVIDMLNDDSGSAKKQVHEVTVLLPPPPPPPELERPPEPEVEEEVDIPEPEEPMPEMADEPPLGDLGVDADGGAGSDGFGLVGRKGGRGLLDGGPLGWYGHILQTSIYDVLSNEDIVRSKSYSIVVEIWITSMGKVEKVSLKEGTGVEEIDQSIKDILMEKMVLSQAPPPGMPQPIKLKITSRL